MPTDLTRLREARKDFEQLERLAPRDSFLLRYDSAPSEVSGNHWCWLRVPHDKSLLTRLCAIAAKAAKACGLNSDSDWFKLLLQTISVENTGWSREARSAGTEVASYSGEIENVVGESIALCHELELEESVVMPAATPRVKDSGPRPERTSNTAAAEANLPTEGAPGLQPEGDAKSPEQTVRAKERQAVVMPILERKKWTRNKLASKAGVSPTCVTEYLAGKRRRLTLPNHKAIADALGIEPKALPN
jgi:hypothetical protein